MITSPVCGGVFIAAGMEDKNWLKVAIRAMALGIGLYIIPLAMVANLDIIELAHSPVAALVDAAQIAVGFGGISYGVIVKRAAWFRLGLIALGSEVIFLL